MLANKKYSLFFFLLTTLAGCTTMSFKDVFLDYASQMAATRQALTANNIKQAQQNLTVSHRTNTNYQLSLLEQGRLAFLANDYAQSQKLFSEAYRTFSQEREQAKIRISKGVENLSALVINDNAIRYQAPAYEQSMMHSYQALNYLYQGNMESALVEVRRANFIQEQALQTYQAEIEEIRQQQHKVNADWQAINGALSHLDSRIGEVKNGFQNAYTFYLSGIMYEATNQDNDAYIDYKKALEISPNNTFIQQDVLRLANKLGMNDDLAAFSRQFADQQTATQTSAGQLVIIYEQALIDAKQEVSLNLPIYYYHNDLRFYRIAVPTYETKHHVTSPMSIAVNNTTIESQQLVALQSLVSKQLKDRMPALISRQVLRLVAKDQLRKKMSREGGEIGSILAGIYGFTSERADTRSWLTLPGDVQLLKTYLSPGINELAVQGVAGLTHLKVNIRSGGITLAIITNIGDFTHYKVSNL